MEGGQHRGKRRWTQAARLESGRAEGKAVTAAGPKRGCSGLYFGE